MFLELHSELRQIVLTSSEAAVAIVDQTIKRLINNFKVDVLIRPVSFQLDPFRIFTSPVVVEINSLSNP